MWYVDTLPQVQLIALCVFVPWKPNQAEVKKQARKKMAEAAVEDKPVRVLGHAEFDRTKLAAVTKLLTELCAAAEAEEGCVSFTHHHSAEDDGESEKMTVLVMGHFTSMAAADAHKVSAMCEKSKKRADAVGISRSLTHWHI